MPAENFVINVITTGTSKAVADQEKVAASTTAMGTAAGKASAASAAAGQRFSRRWTAAGNTMTAAGKKVKTFSLVMAGVGIVSGKLAIDFEKAMRNVNSIAQLPEKQFQKLNKQVLDLAGPTAQAPKTLAEGLYDLVSSGFDANESLTILKASAKAATAGLTTTEVSTKAVAAALNAYRRPASDAKQISDDLFQTVNLGVVTFDELASTIGFVLPAAATLGVDIKQVGAAISTLTKQGQSGSSAVTNINAALTAFIKPSKGMQAVLKELGVESATSLIHQKGFQGALEAVTHAVHGDKEAIGELFPNVRAMRGVFGLTGHNARSAAKDLRGFKNDTGATAKVFKEQSKSAAFQLQKFRSEVEVTAIKLGKDLIPTFKEVVDIGKGVVETFVDLPGPVKTAAVSFVLFGALLSPVLRIMGTMTTAVGSLISALGGLELVQATKAFGPEGFRVFGAAGAKSLVGGMARALPAAAAAAGLGTIIYSATKGDWTQAGAKGGGAIIGGIIGAFVGKSPQSAMLGAAVGSFAGGAIAGLFEGGESGQEKFAKRAEESVKRAAAGRRQLARSGQQVIRAERSLAQVANRQADVQQRLKATQDRLNDARKKGDTARVRREEARLNELKAKQVHLTHQQYRGETLLHAAKIKNEQDARRERSFAVALVRTREQQLGQAQQRIRQARKEFESAVMQNKPLKEQNEREKDLIAAQKRRKGAAEKLKASEKELGGVMKEITQKFGKDFADQLRKSLPLWTQTATQQRESSRALKQLAPNVTQAGTLFERYGSKAKNAGQEARTSINKTKGTLGPFREKSVHEFGKAGESVKDFAGETVRGMGRVQHATSSAAQALHVPSPDFGLSAFEGKARGGTLTKVRGTGFQDSVPLTGSGINAMVAPGEDVMVATRHQRPLLDRAVQAAYGVRGLGEFFRKFNTPHFLARGGPAIPEPDLTGPAPLEPIGQSGIHTVTMDARKWLRAVGGKRTLRAVINEGNRMDALRQPYLWGGGHGAMPSRDGPWDCSGGTSQLYFGAGWKNLRPMVSSGFESWGLPGPGAVSIYANADHVYSVIKGKGGLGTSDANPSGGFGWFPGGARSGFTVRHADLINLGLGGGGGTGKGQPPAKGQARGGFVFRSRGGPAPPAGGELVGASYYDGRFGTEGAAGVDLTGTMSFAELAMGHALGGLPFHTKLQIGYAGRSIVAEKLDIGLGGDDVRGKNRAIDLWVDAQKALRMPGLAVVKVSPVSGGGPAGSGSPQQERVPAVFHGARTAALNFPSVPKTLHGIDKMLAKYEAEVQTYRHAAKAATGKPQIQHAIEQNVTRIETYLTQLRRARALARREEAKRKITRRLAGKMAKLTGWEDRITASERSYNEAEQLASQLVDLEPVQPQEPGEAAERAWRDQLAGWINEQERPAYANALTALANWRNTTIMGERAAGSQETSWEAGIRSTEREIARINRLDPSSRKGREERTRLPVLRFRAAELRKVLGEGRGLFYPGRKDPVQPPVAPLPGTGSFEDTLVGIQGTHWPDLHGLIPELPGKRAAGAFGGAIWDLQGTIEGLDLKINEGLGTGGGEGNDAVDQELLALSEEEAARLRKELAVMRAQAPVLADYLGAYATGGVLPRDGFYLGHAGETVIPADAGETHVHVSGDIAEFIDVRVEKKLTDSARRAGLARGTPGAAGRRARYAMGRR